MEGPFDSSENGEVDFINEEMMRIRQEIMAMESKLGFKPDVAPPLPLKPQERPPLSKSIQKTNIFNNSAGLGCSKRTNIAEGLVPQKTVNTPMIDPNWHDANALKPNLLQFFDRKSIQPVYNEKELKSNISGLAEGFEEFESQMTSYSLRFL